MEQTNYRLKKSSCLNIFLPHASLQKEYMLIIFWAHELTDTYSHSGCKKVFLFQILPWKIGPLLEKRKKQKIK